MSLWKHLKDINNQKELLLAWNMQINNSGLLAQMELWGKLYAAEFVDWEDACLQMYAHVHIIGIPNR